MVTASIRYSVGNEHNPADPWGRSELMIASDGSARLDHYFSRAPRLGSWTGKVDAAALARLWAGLRRAGFPAVPAFQPVADATVRTLVAQAGGAPQRAVVDWHASSSLPGYAEAFDVLDGIIAQLSGGAVTYPTTQGVIVADVEGC